MPDSLWLEVSGLEVENSTLRVRFRSDATTPKPSWWPTAVDGFQPADLYKMITEARAKGHLVTAALTAKNSKLEVTAVRVVVDDLK